MRTHAVAVGVCSFIAIFSVGAVLHHQYQSVASNQRKARIENTSGNRDRHNRLSLSVSKLKRTYDETEPNLLASEQKSRQKLTKGLSLAFNDCHTTSDIKAHQKTIKKLLGNDLGGKVLDIVTPQAGDNPVGDRSISDHVTSINIGYGMYESASDGLPITINVTYRTPAYIVSQRDPHDKEAHTEHFFIDGDQAVKSGHVTVDDYYNDLYGEPRTNGQPNDLQ